MYCRAPSCFHCPIDHLLIAYGIWFRFYYNMAKFLVGTSIRDAALIKGWHLFQLGEQEVRRLFEAWCLLEEMRWLT